MNQTITRPRPDTDASLRRVLLLNAATSLLAGITAATARSAVADLLGLVGDRAEIVVAAVGVGLIVFALEVALTALRADGEPFARYVALISAADISWVVLTLVALVAVEMSAAGRIIAAAMGAGVASFAALQIRLR